MLKRPKKSYPKHVILWSIFAAVIILNVTIHRQIEIFSEMYDSDPFVEIVPVSREALSDLGYDSEDYTLTFDLRINNEILKFVQKEELPFGEARRLPYYFWTLRYLKMGEDEGGAEAIVLDFNPRGDLIALGDSLILQAQPGTETTIFEAERIAKSFIAKYASADTSDLQMLENSTNQRSVYSSFAFEFSQISFTPTHYTESFSVSVSANRVTDFKRNIDLGISDESSFIFVSDIFFRVLRFIMFFSGVIIVIVFLVKKFKRDEIEYRKGMWIGVITGILFAVNIGLITFSEEGNVLVVSLALLFGGVLLWGLITIAFAVGESITRDTWRDKLRGIDTIFMGKLYVKEIGEYVIRGLSLAGAGLLLYMLAEQLLVYLPGVWIELPEDSGTGGSLERVFLNFVSTNISSIGSFFVLPLLIWGSIFRKKITSDRKLIAVIAVLLFLAGFSNLLIKPSAAAVLAFFPVCLLWSAFYVREDLVTIFVATIAGLFLINMQQMLLLSPYSIGYAIAVYAVILAVYFFGLYAEKKGTSLKEVDLYIPEYVFRIEEKDRIMKELEIAREVQMKFLPANTPDYPYVQIEAICQPAQEIGGDYYDFFPYDDERLGLIIGDVSGKGVHAAFYMTMVKGIIKTLAKEVTSPREILCKLNCIFYENAPRKVFISVIYGVFDFKTGILTYARAGHLPLIVWCENHMKSLQKIPAGMAIGLDSGDKFDDLLEEATCTLEPGDLFLFFTDGISEAGRADGEEFGEERLENILSRFAGNSPDIILEEIKDNVLRFIGKSGRHDDITAIAVQMKDDYKINT